MFDWLFKQAEVVKAKKPTISLEFRNTQAVKLMVWIEPYCIELELKPDIEYRLEATGTEYLLEFSGEYITLCLNNGSGPKVFKRPYAPGFAHQAPWEIDADYSD